MNVLYFVPGGLRKFIPDEKQNTIDLVIAISAAVLITFCIAALVYSAYAAMAPSSNLQENQSVRQGSFIENVSI